MIIIPNMLGEAEFREFTEEDYSVLRKLLNAPLCKYLYEYCKDPECDKELAQRIEDQLGSTIYSYTLQYFLIPDGTVELVKNIVPQTIIRSDTDLDDLIAKLERLKDLEQYLVPQIPARSSQDFKKFMGILSRVEVALAIRGESTTFPDMCKRIKVNSYVFYAQHEKPQSTGIGLLLSKRDKWLISLQGAKYTKYCNEKGIGSENRGSF